MTKTPKEKMIERLAKILYEECRLDGLSWEEINQADPDDEDCWEEVVFVKSQATAIIEELSDQIEWVEGEGDDLYILGIMIMELRELINKQLSLHGEHCGIDARMQGVEGVFKTLKANKLAYNINGGE